MRAHLRSVLRCVCLLSLVAPLGAVRASAQDAAQDQGPIETVDDLLNALEHVERDINRVSTPVVMVIDNALSGSQEARPGRLSYRRVGEEGRTVKQFRVRFDETITEGVREQKVREYIFDGEWLVEKFHDTRLFVKRQMVAPGERWDPLKLGEGPFPVPIGQRRADILREFDAELPADKAQGLTHPLLIEQAQQSHQLVLRPKSGLEANYDFDLVRIWYDRTTLLPRMIVEENLDSGDKTTVVLRDVRTNDEADLAEASFDTAVPPVGSGWDVSVEPWRDSGATAATETVEGTARVESQIRVEDKP